MKKGETKETGFYTLERPKGLTADIVLHIEIQTVTQKMFIVGG